MATPSCGELAYGTLGLCFDVSSVDPLEAVELYFISLLVT